MLKSPSQGRQFKLVVHIFFLLKLNLCSLEQFSTVYIKVNSSTWGIYFLKITVYFKINYIFLRKSAYVFFSPGTPDLKEPKFFSLSFGPQFHFLEWWIHP